MVTFEHDGQTKGFSVVSESELEGFSCIPRPDFQNMFQPLINLLKKKSPVYHDLSTMEKSREEKMKLGGCTCIYAHRYVMQNYTISSR